MSYQLSMFGERKSIPWLIEKNSLFGVPKIIRGGQSRRIHRFFVFLVDRHAPCFHREENVTLRRHVDDERRLSSISFSDLLPTVLLLTKTNCCSSRQAVGHVHTWICPKRDADILVGNLTRPYRGVHCRFCYLSIIIYIMSVYMSFIITLGVNVWPSRLCTDRKYARKARRVFHQKFTLFPTTLKHAIMPCLERTSNIDN